MKSSGLPTINDSQQSRATAGADHPSTSSNKQLSNQTNPKSPKNNQQRKLIISEEQITRFGEENAGGVSSVRNQNNNKGLPQI